MRPLHLRTQQEISDRILDAISRGDQGDEFNEYMRCAKFVPLALRSVYEDTTDADWQDPEHPGEVNCDDANEIDAIAKKMLPILARCYNDHNFRRARFMARQFRAWKWLLGHDDADIFLVPFIGAVVDYLNDDIYSGEWDAQTRRFREERKRANAAINEEATALRWIDRQRINDSTSPVSHQHVAEVTRGNAEQTPANTKAVA